MYEYVCFAIEKKSSIFLYDEYLYKNFAAFSHVTHGVLQERNLEGQTLLAIIEVNRYTLYIQVKEYMKSKRLNT